MRIPSAFVLSLIGAIIVVSTAGRAQETKLPVPPEVREPRVQVAWNRLYDFPEVESILKQLQRAYPRLARLESIGKSVEGRDMWLLTVHDPSTGADTEKPAMWVDGNVHGNEVQAAEACLYLAWYLLENHGKVPMITELLEKKAFYILPSVNPDGRAWWFQNLNTASSSRSGKKPTDSDRDGLLDEDGYDDLDGDGEILQMRKRDPFGAWKTDPEDPRNMIRARPDERGEWTRLGREGIDNDGDGAVNEDGPGGYDMNRNWPSLWQPNYVQFGAGEHPFSYPETRCIGEFILGHPNIAAVQSFHNSGGMILRGPGAKMYGEYPRQDVQVLDILGKTGEKMLPFYRYMIIWKDLYTVYGGFVTWTYEGLGIFSFTNELWSSRRLYARSESGLTQKERLEFNDLLRSGIDHREWKPFDHPTYGEIEIGGWRKTSSRTPPSFLIEEESHRNALFCIYHGREMPEISFSAVEVTALENDRHQIDVEIANRRQIPTISALSRQKRIGLPDRLEMASEGGLKLLFSGVIETRFPERVRAVRHRPEAVLNPAGVGHSRPFRARFIVEGRGTAKLRYRSQKGGTISTEANVGG